MSSVGYIIGFTITALLICALITQLLLWLLRHWTASIPRLLVANGLSLFLISVLISLGKADDGAPNFQAAFASFAVSQFAWLVIGLIRDGRKSRQAKKAEAAEAASASVSPSEFDAAPVSQFSAQPIGEGALPSDERAVRPPVTPQEPPKNENSRETSANVLVRHWRGELPLWVSYWVFGFLANVGAMVFVAGVGGALSKSGGYNPTKILATIVLMWLGLGLVSIWQLVGIWRSASRHVSRKGSRIWAGLAKAAVALGLLRILAEFGQTGYPQIAEAVRMAFLDDPDIPAYSIRIMRNGTEIEVSGGFKYGLNDEFVQILKAAPQVEVVHLNSDGGRLGEAEKLYRTIRERGLSTYTSKRCASACTLAFMAGRERWIHTGGRLGFHAPTFPGMSAADAQEASRSQRELTIEAGVSSDFVSRALATPNSSMWYPTLQELTAARAITGVADAYKFAASGWGPDMDRAAVEEQLTKFGSVFTALKSVRPQDFTKMAYRIASGYLSGESEGALIDAARAQLLPIVAMHRPLADDQTVLDLGRLLVEQYRALAAIDKQLCYEYASGVDAKKNYSAYLPSALRSREVDLTERVLRTSTTRQPVSDKTVEPLWDSVGTRLGKRFRADELAWLTQKNLNSAQRVRYCDMVIAMYEEILNLPMNSAALVLRANFQEIAE